MRALFIASLLFIACFAGCSLMGSLSPLRPLERRMVFSPVAYPIGDWEPKGLDFEDAWFQSKTGPKLHGWYVDHPAPEGVALLCHGNGGNITVLAETLSVLSRRHNLSVLAFDYRGYGRSEGKPSETGILEDARTARTWLADRTGVAESDVILFGISLGGGVAVDLAQDGARGLILASTFTSLPAVAKHHVGWLPTAALMTYEMNSLEKIRKYRGPVLISHGDADEVVPFAHGERLYEAAPGPKRFIAIPGGKHNDPQPKEYRLALEEFIEELAPHRRR